MDKDYAQQRRMLPRVENPTTLMVNVIDLSHLLGALNTPSAPAHVPAASG